MYVDERCVVVGRDANVLAGVGGLAALDRENAQQVLAVNLLGDEHPGGRVRLDGTVVAQPVQVVRRIGLSGRVALQVDRLATFHVLRPAYTNRCQTNNQIKSGLFISDKMALYKTYKLEESRTDRQTDRQT